MDRKKLLILAGVILFVLVAAVAALLTATSQQQPEQTEPEKRYTGTLTCLPHKGADPDQPQTLECAIGMKTIDEKYYALKDMPEASQNIELTTSITVTGDVEKPAANEKYDIEGTIKVRTFEVNNGLNDN